MSGIALPSLPVTSVQRSRLVAAALQVARDAAPYVFGGKSINGFDCSGFVTYAYQKVFPNYMYMDTDGIEESGLFREVPNPQPGDLIFFPRGKNPVEVKKGNQRVFPNHVGIVVDAITWIGCQSSTGVAPVKMTVAWWSARPKLFFQYTLLI